MINIKQNSDGTFTIDSNVESVPITVAEQMINQAAKIILSQTISFDESIVDLARSYKRLKRLNFLFYAAALIFMTLYFLEVR